MPKLHRNTTGIAAHAAGSFNRARTTKAGLLASTALIAGVVLYAPGALADGNYTSGTIFGPVSGTFNANTDPGIVSVFTPATLNLTAAQNSQLQFNTFSVIGAGPNILNLNGFDVNSPLKGIWLWTTTSDVVVNANANVTSVDNSIEMIDTTSGSLLAHGLGVGTLKSTAADGVNAHAGFGGTPGSITVDGFASITGFDDGIEAYVAGAGNMTIQNNGAISGGAFPGSAGVYTRTGTGITLIDSNGPITGNSWAGIDAQSAGGVVTITNNASITSTGIGGASNITDGVYVNAAGGNVLIKNNGPITGSDDGIEAYTTGTGTMTVQANGPITGGAATGPFPGAAGVYTRAAAGATLIDGNGAITGNSWNAVDALSTTGAITITNNAGITSSGKGVLDGNQLDGVHVLTGSGNVLIDNNHGITGADDGIEAYTGGAGTITVTNNGNIVGTGLVAGSAGVYTRAATGATVIANNGIITGPTWSGIDALSSTGPIGINGNGNITGGTFDGITALTAGGPINIGTTATNGVILGARDGIGATSGAGGGSIINIKVDKNVTGTAGIGISASNLLGQSGPVNIDILNAATTVSGGTAGLSIQTVGTGTVNNAGIIKKIGDTGAANDPGGYAILSGFGKNTVNNQAGGQIIGSIFTSNTGGDFVLNNAAGATWTPGTNAGAPNTFGQATDTINNSGLINIRTGITGLASGNLDNVFLDNKAGGVIDMTYGDTVSPAALNAKDSLWVDSFKAEAGSTLKVDVDFTQAHNTGSEQAVGGVANDRSTNNGGLGTADTIVTRTAANPGATSNIELKTVGGAKVGSSGSIAIIDTSATGYAGIADPGLGGLPKLLANASKNYVLVNDPSTGAVKYALIEDSLGGVSLVWAPNITASSLGGYGGATGAGTPGGPSSGTAIASASGAANGVGGLGNSGGPSGGGAAGHIADMAAGSALQQDDIADPGQGGSLKDGGGVVAAAECSRVRTAWGQGEASRTNSDGGGDGRAENFSGGVETGLGKIEGRGCNRVAVGVFGFAGKSENSWSTGRDDTDNAGAGAYIRASSALGLYGSLLGSWTWANSDLTNNVFGSTAKKDSDGFTGVATFGFVTRLAERSAIDIRTYVAYGNIDGDGFTDSQGITVSGSHDDLVTVGASIGLYTALTGTLQGFVRGGVKWSQVDSSMTAFGITAKGSAEETSGSVEAGFVARASQGVEFGTSGFGEFSESTTGYGGRAHVSVRF